MTATVYTLSSGWSSGARYTASGSTDVLLGNPDDLGAVRWTITANDTTPVTDPDDAVSLGTGDNQPMILADGERLWLAGIGKAVVEI